MLSNTDVTGTVATFGKFSMMHTLELANTHIDGDVSNLAGCKSLEVSQQKYSFTKACVEFSLSFIKAPLDTTKLG